MWVSNTSTPISSTNRDDTKFCKDHCSTNGCCYFFGTFYSETNVAITIADDYERLESSTLTSTSLFLYWTNLKSVPFIDMRVYNTFITSSLSLGRNKSTIWYSLIGNECK